MQLWRAVTGVEISCFKERGEKNQESRALSLTHAHTHTAYSLCASTSSSSPFTAAEEGARRALGPAELARAGCVHALRDEHVQIGNTYLLLRLGLWEEGQHEAEYFLHTDLTTDISTLFCALLPLAKYKKTKRYIKLDLT